MTLRQALERYGVALAVVLGLVVALIVLPGNTTTGPSQLGAAAGSGRSTGAGAAAGSGGAALGAAGSGTAGPGAGLSLNAGGGGGSTGSPGTPAGSTAGSTQAAPAGSAVTWGAGPHCRGDGRQMGVSYAMPPCVQWNSRDNGGATGQGVTRNKILVVRYIPQIDPGTRAILQSAQLSDPPATVSRAYQALTRYGNLHYETYGRQVVMVDFNASGPPTSDENSRADAIAIAGNIKPFAVIDGDPAQGAPLTFVRELALRDIPCFCSTSYPSDIYGAMPPIVFSPLPTLTEYAQNSAEYVCKHLAGHNVQYAGLGVTGPRKFGLVYVTGQNEVPYPELEEAKPLAEKYFGQCGIHFFKEIGYSYDPGRNQTDVTNLIAQLKAAGVTTVVPFWDPLYPILITQEATRQAFFPEWIITGTGLSDTTTAGRLYDQQQWRHAFGTSPLWITWATVSKSAGYREYHWARPQDPPGSEGVLINIYRSRIAELFTSIHMAGPVLDVATLSAGALAYPHTGGSPGRPLLYRTRQYPTAIKDFSEVYYDTNASGPDERGDNGRGMITRADGGRRYQIGQWYTGPPHVFQNAPAPITVTDDPPGGGDWPTDTNPGTYPAGQACLDCS
ncbi:MAG TPA: hypothetical protein VFH50_12560 [Acidimicrobiales bacterium]|nr:hypothetical protein [Acidimicrobiales bacterium]